MINRLINMINHLINIINNRWARVGLTAVAWIAVVIFYAMGELDRRGAYDLDTVIYNVLGWGVFGALVLGFVAWLVWFNEHDEYSGYQYYESNRNELSGCCKIMTEEELYAHGYWSVYDSRALHEASKRLHGYDK